MDTAHLLPHDKEAEMGVLGTVLHDNGALAEVLPILDGEHFFLPAHREIFVAMQDLFDRASPIDEITLVHQLRTTGRLDSVGGPVYIAELRDAIPAASNVLSYAHLVREMAELRALISTTLDIANRARQQQGDTYEQIEDARRLLDVLSQNAAANAATERNSAEVWGMVERRYVDDDRTVKPIIPILTHTSVDRYIGHLPDGFVTVVAARTSMGKSIFAAQTAMRNAWVGIPSCVFSLEMWPETMMARMACAVAGINSMKLLRGRARNFTDDEWGRFSEASGHLRNLPIYWPRVIRNTPMDRIEAEAAFYVRERGVRLIVVDHMRLVNAGGRGPYERATESSGALATLAMRLEVPILAVVQINREGAKADVPSIHHAEGSGAIEQDAETIMILHGPAPDSDERQRHNGQEMAMNAIVGKARDGTTGTREILAELHYSRFDHAYWQEKLAQRNQQALGFTG